MCGRFSLAVDPAVLLELFPGLEVPGDYVARYNIAPTQNVLAVVNGKHGVKMESLRWGLIPSWAKDMKMGASMINARAESLHEKPAFRSAYQRRRCLIPADGFYEWKKLDEKTKQPMRIHMKDGEPFAFAGLWEYWAPKDGEGVLSCTIVTTESNALLREVHDRMPVIVPPEEFERWLDPSRDAADLLKPFPAERLAMYPVSRMVNSARIDVPECAKPVEC